MPRRGPLGFSMSHYRDLADGWATNRGGGPAPKTYADWQAHIAARATSGPISQTAITGLSTGIYRTVLGPGEGSLFGSPFKSFFGGPSLFPAVRRVIQHGLPDEATFNAQVSQAREVVFRTLAAGDQQFYTALDRNGFLSSGGDQEVTMSALACDLVGWWDEATQSALMINPQAGTGPVPYAAQGWV